MDYRLELHTPAILWVSGLKPNSPPTHSHQGLGLRDTCSNPERGAKCANGKNLFVARGVTRKHAQIPTHFKLPHARKKPDRVS